jgi:hypothetical protein
VLSIPQAALAASGPLAQNLAIRAAGEEWVQPCWCANDCQRLRGRENRFVVVRGEGGADEEDRCAKVAGSEFPMSADVEEVRIRALSDG